MNEKNVPEGVPDSSPKQTSTVRRLWPPWMLLTILLTSQGSAIVLTMVEYHIDDPINRNTIETLYLASELKSAASVDPVSAPNVELVQMLVTRMESRRSIPFFGMLKQRYSVEKRIEPILQNLRIAQSPTHHTVLQTAADDMKNIGTEWMNKIGTPLLFRDKKWEKIDPSGERVKAFEKSLAVFTADPTVTHAAELSQKNQFAVATILTDLSGGEKGIADPNITKLCTSMSKLRDKFLDFSQTVSPSDAQRIRHYVDDIDRRRSFLQMVNNQGLEAGRLILLASLDK